MLSDHIRMCQVGTLEYMAPEVLQQLGGLAPADVYALAVTLNEAATGVRPFSDCMRDNPACQTVLNYNYGRCGQCLACFVVENLSVLFRGWA